MSLKKPFSPLLSCEQIACERGGELLFDGLGFSLFEGGLLAVCGLNGSGKTSLLKIIAGITSLQEGKLEYRGHEIEQAADYRNEMLYLGHANGLKEEMTVLDHLHWWAALYDTELALAAAVHYFDMVPYLNTRCGSLSAGWRRRVALMRLMLSPGSLWLLDEPASNLDAEGAYRLGGLITSHMKRGGGAIITIHTPEQPFWLPQDAPMNLLWLDDFQPEYETDYA